jgi:hypothetical protein
MLNQIENKTNWLVSIVYKQSNNCIQYSVFYVNYFTGGEFRVMQTQL